MVAATEQKRPLLDVDMSVTGRTWRPRLDEAGEARAGAIRQRAGVSHLTACVLAGRGVAPEDAARFLAPSLRTDLPDPSALADMDAAARRLADAVEAREPVAIFGDYDVDGATSAALLHTVLAGLGSAPAIYIPDRIFEGYGPNVPAIDRLIDAGARLIVAVDCGSTSFEPLARARQRGVDVVVLDHHQVGADLPTAAAIVNPNRQDDVSGQGHLAAVGVAFLAAVALVRELRRRGAFASRAEPDLLRLLDLVALGTICDVVPLVGVNRTLAVKGLVALRHTERPGLIALAAAARLKGPCEARYVGHVLGPRINAGGRIGDAGLGARLLCATRPHEAEAMAETLERLNRERQTLEAEAVAEAVEEVEGAQDPDPHSVILLAREGWHPGVAGLIAARLRERFDRPAFAICLEPNAAQGTGSGRSVPGVDLGAAVRAALDAGLLARGGGHAMAAGLTIDRDKLADLSAFFAATLSDGIALARSDRARRVDGVLVAGAATAGLLDELDKAGPFGAGHPEPIFALPAHRIAFADRVGTNHVRVELQDDAGQRLKAIAFNAADAPLGRLLTGARGARLHVLGALSMDNWNGRQRPQLRILDAAEPGGRS